MQKHDPTCPILEHSTSEDVVLPFQNGLLLMLIVIINEPTLGKQQMGLVAALMAQLGPEAQVLDSLQGFVSCLGRSLTWHAEDRERKQGRGNDRGWEKHSGLFERFVWLPVLRWEALQSFIAHNLCS